MVLKALSISFLRLRMRYVPRNLKFVGALILLHNILEFHDAPRNVFALVAYVDYFHLHQP
jgi:hypothetical protein